MPLFPLLSGILVFLVSLLSGILVFLCALVLFLVYNERRKKLVYLLSNGNTVVAVIGSVLPSQQL